MDFDEYQEKSQLTDQQGGKKSTRDVLTIPLLGLAGEAGTLLTEFKKKFRDKHRYEGFDQRAEEELGDILWYLSNIASRLGLSLSVIAAKNLLKTQERWPISPSEGGWVEFDPEYPETEQLPRFADIHLFQDPKTGVARMELLPDRCLVGAPLTDNAYSDDGYRFHDVMHLAHWAVLGWSPVMRALLQRKRKSSPTVDEVEDGARAAIIEELLVAFVYTNATNYSLFEGARSLDSEMLATIKRLVAHLEVKIRRTADWENAIKQGYTAFRHLNEHKQGTLRIDMNRRRLQVVKK